MALKKKEENQEDLTNEAKSMALAPSTGSVFEEEKGTQHEKFKEELGSKQEQEVLDVTEKEAVMPISAVEKLLKDSEERMTNIFNSKIQKLQLQEAKGELAKDAEYVSSLEDDWLEIPAVFFSYSINFSIHGDSSKGKQSVPPHGAVRFLPIIRSKRQTRKGEEVISVSSVKVHSRAVANWLREHSCFGISFFENMESALNVDSGWAQKLIEANQSIQKLSDQQVIARCRQQGLPVGTDVVMMRKVLVEESAQKSIKLHDDIMYGKLRKSNIDSKTDRQITEGTLPLK